MTNDVFFWGGGHKTLKQKSFITFFDTELKNLHIYTHIDFLVFGVTFVVTNKLKDLVN